MKAVLLTAYGDTDKLELREIPEPTPGPNEVKVRVASASINPIDWKLRRGELKSWMPLELPSVLGRDAAGEVVAVGSGVTAFKPGDRVMGLVQKAYAELVVGPAEGWAVVAAGLETSNAGALPLVVLTGVQLLEEGVDPQPGATVLVTGALGSVGRAAVYAAKLRGARVWAGVRAQQKGQAADLGVDGVVALDDDADLDRLPALDAVADTVGGAMATKLFAKLKPGATFATVVGEPAGAKERGFVVRAIHTHPDAARLADLGTAAARRELVIPIEKRFPLANAREAHQLAERGSVGKVLLMP